MSSSRSSLRSAPKSTLTHLECSRSGDRYDADQLQTCSRGGFPLLARYDLDAAAHTLTRASLAGRERSMWRYAELLPVRESSCRVTMDEGWTPLYELPRLAAACGLGRLLIKDEGFNPGGTFKARGASAAVSRAVELGARHLAISTNGNAGEALALYAARAGVEATVIMPVESQAVTQRICTAAGAHTYLVDGYISDAGRIIKDAAQAQNWLPMNTFFEPYRLEGKKTVGFEITEQLGWRMPDVMLFPTGGGIAIAAFHKAWQELSALGLLSGPLPRLISVQAENCAPFVRAFEQRAKATEYWENAQTFASGLRVPKSFGDRLVLEALYASDGHALTVSDEEMRQGLARALQLEGVLLCPEDGGLIIALERLRELGEISSRDEVVLFGTGNGLKYAEALPAPSLPVIAAQDNPFLS